METYKASLIQENDNQYLSLMVGSRSLNIPLTQDSPNEIKQVFNQLIVQLEGGVFKFDLEAVGTDLFSQIATVYVEQLNKELANVYEELVQAGFNHFEAKSG